MSRVLIVDDEASICWAFGEYLGDLGHEVAVAATAEEGLDQARRSPLDAVVLDVRLPGIDGLSAMTAFREHLGAAPIIVITAFGNLDTAIRAMDAGAFDYLVKPFDLDQAAAVVQRALETGPTTAGALEPAVGLDPERQPPARLIGGSAPDAGAVQADRTGRGHRRPRADHRRERHRQGAGRAGDPRARRAGEAGRSSPSAWPRSVQD